MRNYSCKLIFIAAFIFLLSACGNGRVYAPVSDIATIEKIPSSGIHRVKSGETLYAIAWRYGIDYRNLATVNNISSPWRVKSGEIIYLKKKPSSYRKVSNNIAKTKRAKRNHISKGRSEKIKLKRPNWHWPAKGRLVGRYSVKNRGINIAGKINDAIFATAKGCVVYAGDGLRGYGNLVIIKHNSSWLSAYAWNKKIMVREGQKIHRGQQIARMGSHRGQKPMLHFEIRYNGKSVNPLRHLPEKL